jgi:predicted acylesterase/phospholipase RssA
MPIRLAITVAGAVSLGSYEAGVLYELVDALAQHNVSQNDKIVIDVLTGASAGGMSATVLAQKLLFEADSLTDPYRNVLYQAWVQDIQMQSLLSLQHNEDPTYSILSSNLIEALSAKYLCQRYSTHIHQTPVKHAAAADVIHLGLALSNLNGLDYRCNLNSDATFIYTRFEDQMRAIADSASDTFDFWEPLRNAAVACGAFPLAFRVKDLVRHRDEFDSPDIVFPRPFETFAYTDGGVFQNEPLGLAKDLVDAVDQHTNTESRFYLFVAPHIRSSTAHPEFNQDNASLRSTALQLFNAIYGQAEFRDWIQAEQVNGQVDLFNRRAIQLKDALAQGRVPSAPLREAATALLPLLIAGGTDESIDQGRQRLKQQFSVEYEGLKTSRNLSEADIWIDSILTLEWAAGLGKQDEMVIYGITASAKELASSQLEAFAGFLEQGYREHDYNVGRTKAQEFLQNKSGRLGTDGNLPIIRYVPKPIDPINHDLDGLRMSDIPQTLLEPVKHRLSTSADAMLEELGVAWPIREAIKMAVIDPQLRKVFGF